MVKIIFDKKLQHRLEQERLKQLQGDLTSEESEKEEKQEIFSDVDSDDDGNGNADDGEGGTDKKDDTAKDGGAKKEGSEEVITMNCE